MDDTTRGLGDDRDEMVGRGDDTTRNRESGTTVSPSRVPTTGRSAAPRTRSSRPAGTTGDMDPAADMKTRQIESEIAGTREEMAETIDAIQEKLRPANVVAEAKEKLKAVTTEKVRHMTDTASETAGGMVRQTREAASGIIEGARQNPIPALMIGAGVAWLLIDRSRSQRSDNGGQRDWRTSDAGGRPYDTQADYYRSQQVAAGTAVDLDEWGGEDRGSYRSAIDDAGARARGMADDARNTLRRSTRVAQNGFQRLMRDNPLLVGAAAIVAGAAVGAALPETERENEWLGEARDSVVDRAQAAAKNAASTVQDVTGDAVKQVTERLGSDEGRNNL
jgi:ElaB/YqjD/DUF883 family membrane-anchored ribosome-binding protein